VTESETPPAKKQKQTPSDFLETLIGATGKDKRDELQKYLESPLENSNSAIMKESGALGWWKVGNP